jgi:CBS domain-containing protein
MMPAGNEITVDPDGESTDALEKMVRSGEGRLPVVKDAKVVG